jgi:hypothetical protein
VIIVVVCCVLGLIWALINLLSVSKIDVEKGITGYEEEGEAWHEIPNHQKNLLLELG